MELTPEFTELTPEFTELTQEFTELTQCFDLEVGFPATVNLFYFLLNYQKGHQNVINK